MPPTLGRPRGTQVSSVLLQGRIAGPIDEARSPDERRSIAGRPLQDVLADSGLYPWSRAMRSVATGGARRAPFAERRDRRVSSSE